MDYLPRRSALGHTKLGNVSRIRVTGGQSSPAETALPSPRSAPSGCPYAQILWVPSRPLLHPQQNALPPGVLGHPSEEHSCPVSAALQYLSTPRMGKDQDSCGNVSRSHPTKTLSSFLHLPHFPAPSMLHLPHFPLPSGRCLKGALLTLKNFSSCSSSLPIWVPPHPRLLMVWDRTDGLSPSHSRILLPLGIRAPTG